jgi:hypothetical protein
MLTKITMQFPDSTSRDGEVAYSEDTRHALSKQRVASELSLSVSVHMHESV